ncbi:PEP/pyruvate-binding domain-containing protein [bacterium]|nr:PEP/pyruvate-binding domain-containing protein [bacterium]
MNPRTESSQKIPEFDRRFFESHEDFTAIGKGEMGGKAHGLAFIKDTLDEYFDADKFPGVTVNIPRLTVLTTEIFDKFMSRNELYEMACSDKSDQLIGHEFQKGDFPSEYIGDVMGLIRNVKTPLAVRSSSLLEDAMYRPFAGVYGTKMIPNNEIETQKRFNKLVEAIKFVWASTFFKEAKAYIQLAGKDIRDEKMAVIIQEVVGQKIGQGFYPVISGVARSYNFYPTGKSKPEQGVVDLALGLGKTIVDGGKVWTYSPEYPRATPPYSNLGEMMKISQTKFWAVNMGKPPAFDPLKETEYMKNPGIEVAEKDQTLKFVASTYNAASDRLSPGVGVDGPRVLNFAPILVHRELPLNDIVKDLLVVCEKQMNAKVEIEFAVTLDPKKAKPARVGFLQVRPMVVSSEAVDISEKELETANLLLASEHVMGNGVSDDISDIIYVKPDIFEAKYTQKISEEIEELNIALTKQNRPFLLIGFGRWGSSDPWLGIPVVWSQISGAKSIVEATLPAMNIDLSQGSHFFHNLSSFGVSYFSVKHNGKYEINWEWLDRLEIVNDLKYVRHSRTINPLKIKVDGRSGRGLISYDEQ